MTTKTTVAVETSRKVKIDTSVNYATPQAAELLGISSDQFRKLADKLDYEPADWYINPHYKSGPECPKWSGHDLVRMRRTNLYKSRVANKRDRTEASKKAVETRRRKTIDHVDSVPIQIPEMSLQDLIKAAIGFYLSGSLEKYGVAPYARDCVNYLRHDCTNYDYTLRRIAGKTGIDEAYLQLKGRVLDAIADKYPELGDECRQQMSRTLERVLLRF